MGIASLSAACTMLDIFSWIIPFAEMVLFLFV